MTLVTFLINLKSYFIKKNKKYEFPIYTSDQINDKHFTKSHHL